MTHPTAALACLLAAAAAQPETQPMPRTVRRQAAETLTAVEMDLGDTLAFTFADGRTVRMTAEKMNARIIERVEPGGVVYAFACDVRIDGRAITLRRYVCSQECFYEPIVVNGMRVWLDAVSAIFEMIPMRKIETQRVPRRQVRLAVQDATRPICPQRLRRWYINDENVLDVGDCYNGDDCWLGPYLGRACHGGLDINHAKGEPLWAPIDFDDHWLFNSLADGHNNNRWRGVRAWPSGDTWVLQTHHLIRMLVEEHTKLPAGTKYATTAGVHIGSHEHTHYVFKVRPKQGGAEIHLDPWILFREIFEANRRDAGELRAAMAPLAPAKAGEAVAFSARGSRASADGGKLRCFWTFGDGGVAAGPRPKHVFAAPGVYPVTLTVEDGAARKRCTQHVTVGGRAARTPVLALTALDEPSFLPRPVDAMDIYGQPVRVRPHTLRFAARPGGKPPAAWTVRLANLGGGELAAAGRPKVAYAGNARGWLSVEPAADGDGQLLRVRADPSDLSAGVYEAAVTVGCAGAANSPQRFGVELRIRPAPRKRVVVVDDRDAAFEATPYFWVGHQFCRCRRRGHAGRYLTNGGRPRTGAFARFRPDLAAGRYAVSFHEATPFAPGVRFDVRIRHAGGTETRTVRPGRDRSIGTFDFAEGTSGWVELLAAGSEGLVLADAAVFRRAKR